MCNIQKGTCGKKRNFQNCILGLAYLTLKGQRSKVNFLFMDFAHHDLRHAKKKLSLHLSEQWEIDHCVQQGSSGYQWPATRGQWPLSDIAPFPKLISCFHVWWYCVCNFSSFSRVQPNCNFENCNFKCRPLQSVGPNQEKVKRKREIHMWLNGSVY